MTELTFHQQAVLWGQAYEVLVKRGVLACLIEQGLIERNRPGLERWRELKLLDVSRSLTKELNILDEAARDVIKAGVRHLALTAYGAGYTATREYLKAVRKNFAKNPDALKVKALWCPLMLPGESTLERSARAETREAFYKEMGLTGIVDPDWSRKGQPANADFLLWLSAGAPKDDYLLVQEYSYDMPGSLGDFREQGAHLDELTRHRRTVDSRSVFARVAAEVSGEAFELSEDIQNYLGALTGDNKPLYKLCQACSYAETTVALLQARGLMDRTCQARALAITPNGLESLNATFKTEGEPEPRRLLMAQMASAYRNTQKMADGDEDGLLGLIERVFKGVVNKLPKELRTGMKDLRSMPQPGEDYVFEFEEQVAKFYNPVDEFTLGEAVAMVDEGPELQQYFGGSVKKAVGTVMQELMGNREKLSLRDVHAASIVAGMQCAKPGKLNVVALEGNPGIGKTTALRVHLGKKQDGFLFLYQPLFDSAREEDVAALGARLRRLLLTRWSVMRDSLRTVRSMLIALGHESRAADKYAPLVAGYVAFVSDVEPSVEAFRALLDELQLMKPEEQVVERDADVLMRVLLDRKVVVFVPREGHSALKLHLPIREVVQAVIHGPDETRKPLTMQLEEFGLRPIWSSDDAQWKLAVCTSEHHAGMRRLMQRTDWALGGWKDAVSSLLMLSGCAALGETSTTTWATREAATSAWSASTASSRSPVALNAPKTGCVVARPAPPSVRLR